MLAASPTTTSTWWGPLSMAEPDVCAPIDANGNLTADGTRTFEWDARDRLVAVNIGTHRSEFIYDGVQRRARVIEKEAGVVQSDIHQVWCRRMLCEERSSSGASVSRRLFSLGEEISGQPRLFALDHIGGPWVVSDMSAAVVSRFEFGPWGESVVSQGAQVTNVGFSGHQFHPPSSLILALYRGYSTATARWLSEDPLRWQEGPNLYNYTAGNPVRWRDAFGLKVYRCCRDIEVGPILNQLAKAIGAKHCFIKTDKREGGMGPADGGPLPRNPLGIKTSMIDHTGQSSRSDCEEIPDADEKCVDNRLAQGGSTGRWMPWNNCNTVADDVLCDCNSKRCSIDPYNTPRKPGGYR